MQRRLLTKDLLLGWGCTVLLACGGRGDLDPSVHVEDRLVVEAPSSRQSTGVDATNQSHSSHVQPEGGGAKQSAVAGLSGSPLVRSYDSAILADHPVGFWPMNKASGNEPDLTGKSHPGTYKGGVHAVAMMPNGDPCADFNGSSQYLTIPSSLSLSIPTTGNLTWEGWIRPDVLQFPVDGRDGYVDWMGKCEQYAPTCEWEARMYSTKNSEGRCNRLSAYSFNPNADLGSGAAWQPNCGLFSAGQWFHVVGEYTLGSQPSDCPDAALYPGSINIWVNGVPWNQADHSPTGCMSQYKVNPQAKASPLNIGTMAHDTWFQGAIGKVAIYDYLLSQTQIAHHYHAMTGIHPTGSCADTCSF